MTYDLLNPFHFGPVNSFSGSDAVAPHASPAQGATAESSSDVAPQSASEAAALALSPLEEAAATISAATLGGDPTDLPAVAVNSVAATAPYSRREQQLRALYDELDPPAPPLFLQKPRPTYDVPLDARSHLRVFMDMVF